VAEDPLSGYEEVDDEELEKKFGRKPRRNQAQYALLQKCSAKKDITEWNDWRKAKPREVVYLEGVDLAGAHIERANLDRAHLEGASLEDAHLEGADMLNAHLEDADLWDANLRGACLLDAHLERATLFHAHLEGAVFAMAVVDGETAFDGCTLDKNTNFCGVGMGGCRMAPGLKDTLDYNIRRIRWGEWCDNGRKWRRVVRLFWWTSDYGRSTGRIAVTFLILSVAFGLLYWVSELCGTPGMVQDLSKVGSTDVPKWLVPFRAQYFSIVTMTTLGFGDMHANPLSLVGHATLAFQVILGYVLLGALICRLGILFQGHGPPVKFSPEWTGRRWDDPEPKPEDESAEPDTAS
jgi:pentapeptide repeat protein/ion channel